MSEYKIPGVYIEEQSVFPPSVSATETAIPAFLGYTANEVEEPQKIQSLMEFEAIFGLPPASSGPTVSFPDGMENGEPVLNWDSAKNFHLYYYVEHYFKNGGGPCYVISTGVAGAAYPGTGEAYTHGLEELKKLDEPTLIVLTDALATLEGAGNYASRHAAYFGLLQEALQQCGDLKDRFVIADMPDAMNEIRTATSDFREAINANQSYAAAYYPYLDTSLNRRPVFGYNVSTWQDENITNGKTYSSFISANNNKLPLVTFDGDGTPSIVIDVDDANPVDASATVEKLGNTVTLTLHLKEGQGYMAAQIFAALDAIVDKEGFLFEDKSGASTAVFTAENLKAPTMSEVVSEGSLSDLKDNHPGLFTRITNAIAKTPLRMPPAPAMAGVYASVDRDRGVWKAPANVGLSATKAPAVRLSQEDQAFLDIDETSGKSVNCILHFTGKGVIPWGARTLDASNLDWRYISVRRLFMMAEESIKKAARFAVFEPNDKNTWSKVKAMINNYLLSLWQKGALMGAKPDQGFFVKVGLGESMTFQDVLDGKMIVQVGMAPVHPAEFIILRFSQMQQTS